MYVRNEHSYILNLTKTLWARACFFLRQNRIHPSSNPFYVRTSLQTNTVIYGHKTRYKYPVNNTFFSFLFLQYQIYNGHRVAEGYPRFRIIIYKQTQLII